MIGPMGNVQVWLVCGVSDMRRGIDSLAAQVQLKLEANPYGGHMFVFRGRRGDRVKILWYDGNSEGMCLFLKRLERGQFFWPQAADGAVHLTQGQLSMLLEGINWLQPAKLWRPRRAA